MTRTLLPAVLGGPQRRLALSCKVVLLLWMASGCSLLIEPGGNTGSGDRDGGSGSDSGGNVNYCDPLATFDSAEEIGLIFDGIVLGSIGDPSLSADETKLYFRLDAANDEREFFVVDPFDPESSNNVAVSFFSGDIQKPELSRDGQRLHFSRYDQSTLGWNPRIANSDGPVIFSEREVEGPLGEWLSKYIDPGVSGDGVFLSEPQGSFAAFEANNTGFLMMANCDASDCSEMMLSGFGLRPFLRDEHYLLYHHPTGIRALYRSDVAEAFVPTVLYSYDNEVFGPASGPIVDPSSMWISPDYCTLYFPNRMSVGDPVRIWRATKTPPGG